MILLKENISWTQVMSDNPQELGDVDNLLYDKMVIPIPGAKYSKQYRYGDWDGLIHFYNKTDHSIPSGHLSWCQNIILASDIGTNFKVLDNRPDKFVDIKDIPDHIELKNGDSTISLRDYQVQAVKSIFENTRGVVNLTVNAGKTEVAAAAIKYIYDKLEPDERVLFFAGNKQIYTQTVARLKKRLGVEIGEYSATKKLLRKVTVCMIQSVESAIKVDPEQNLTLSAKERIYKKIKYTYLPRFSGQENPSAALASFVSLYTPKTKADESIKKLLAEISKSTINDHDVLATLKQYADKYDDVVDKKAHDKVKKKKYINDLLSSAVMIIGDECQHTRSNTWYDVFMSCTNALYRVGLSGTVDKQDESLTYRLKAVFGGIISKFSNEQAINRGISARPTIILTPIKSPEGLSSEKNWAVVYKEGIVENEYRNKAIAAFCKKFYEKGKSVLVMVNQIKHGENIGAILDRVKVPYQMIHGDQDNELQAKEKDDFESGKNKILIATSVLNEGVDIANINVLVQAAGGKSFVQTIQRTGRVLRKKTRGANIATVVDFIDYQSPYLYRHSQARKNLYEEQGFKVVK